MLFLSDSIYICCFKYIYMLFLSDEGPMLETLDYTIRIGSTPTIITWFAIAPCYIFTCMAKPTVSRTR